MPGELDLFSLLPCTSQADRKIQWGPSNPTIRSLKNYKDLERSIIISCNADVGVWRPLEKEGWTIYNVEILLNGALTQEIRWDDESYKELD